MARFCTSMEIRFLLAIFATLLVLVLPVQADGGKVIGEASHEELHFVLFASPFPVVAGPCELSVFIQDAATRKPILDAVVAFSLKKLSAPTPELAWVGPGCISSGQSRPATRGHAGNQFLYSVLLGIPEPGLWELTIVAQHDDKNASVSFPIEVAAAPRILWSFWGLVAIVPIGIALYAWRRALISHRRS